ncbi:MAG: hypothetical protein H6838_06080 [Planctomycetes bacterium]|nr:hypothetical protein [Planctomycetota bacterium]
MPYRRAHWFLLVALAAIVAGFWPSFFASMGAGDFAHTLHGVSATLWVCALVLQSWLIAHHHRQWHRRVAWGALVLLPVLVGSGLQMVQRMLVNTRMPPALPPLLSWIDVCSLTFLLLLVGLGLANVRRPAAHVRLMCATVLLGLPPALTRLYARLFAPQVDFMAALHGSFVTVELACAALIVADLRAGRRHLAWPLSLLFAGSVHASMGAVATSETWLDFTRWYVTLPIFG